MTSIEKKMLIVTVVMVIGVFIFAGFVVSEIKEHGLKSIVETIWEGES